MTMRAEDRLHWETERPDCIALLVRDYKSMQEAVIAIPRANIERAEAEGRPFRWQHGDELELHANGELCAVVCGPFAPSDMGDAR